MVPLARLYGPGDFGLFAIMQSLVMVGTTVVALRYDLAIVLPQSELAARVLQKLASTSTLLSSSVLSVALLVAQPWVALHYRNEPFGWWMITVGLAVYLAAQVMNIQFWLTRQQNYRAIASNRLIQALSVALFQVAFWFWIDDFRGLIAGLLAGQLVTLLLVLRRAPELRSPLSQEAPTRWEMAKRYRKMPVLNGPTAVLDAVKNAGINILIGNIAVSGLGQFSLAYQLTKAPVSLLTSSVSQVLLKQLALTKPGGMVKLLRDSSVRIALFAVPAFALLYVIAPLVFPLVLGKEWSEAGRIAQALVPWLFMMTFTSPMSNLMVVVEKQEWALLFAIISTAAPLVFLSLTQLDLVPAITWLSYLMAALLALWIGMAYLIARHFDRRGNPETIEA